MCSESSVPAMPVPAVSLPTPFRFPDCVSNVLQNCVSRHARAIPFALRPAFKIASALLKGLIDR